MKLRIIDPVKFEHYKQVIHTEEPVLEAKETLSQPGISKVDIVLETLDLSNKMQKEYAQASERDKKLMFRFFIYGMFTMLGTMVMSLWALGFVDILFYTKFVGGIIFSLGFAFAFESGRAHV